MAFSHRTRSGAQGCHLLRPLGQSLLHRVELERFRGGHVLVDQPEAIDQPNPIGGRIGAQPLPLQQAMQPFGDAAARATGPKNHDLLVAQVGRLPFQARQDGGGGHTAGALDVVVEAGQAAAEALQQPAALQGAEVFPVHQGVGPHRLDRPHKGRQKGVVGLSSQPRFPQAGVMGIGQQGGVVGAHIQHHRQGAPRMQPRAEGVHRQLAVADLHAPHPLVANPQDPLGIGYQQQLRRLWAGLHQQRLQLILLAGVEIKRLRRTPVAAAELLNGPPHRGRVHHRHQGFDVGGEQGMKQHQIGLAQGLEIGVALEIAGETAGRLPAALHLLLEGFHLVGQQGFQAKGPPFGAAKGGALVAQRILQGGERALSHRSRGHHAGR